MAPSCLAPRALQPSRAAQPGLMLSPGEMLADKDEREQLPGGCVWGVLSGTGALPVLLKHIT